MSVQSELPIYFSQTTLVVRGPLWVGSPATLTVVRGTSLSPSTRHITTTTSPGSLELTPTCRSLTSQPSFQTPPGRGS